VEPTDLAVRILQEIRDEVRALNGRWDQQNDRVEARFEQQNARFEAQCEQQNARFEAIETALRDVAE
jgi:hypothetical protein